MPFRSDDPSAAAPQPDPTVVARFLEVVGTSPDAPVITLVEGLGQVLTLTASDLYGHARAAAAGLRSAGVQPGDRIVVALPTARPALAVYLGSLCSGVIPIMTPPPHGPPGRFAEHAAALLGRCQAALVVVPTRAAAAALTCRSASAEDLLGPPGAAAPHVVHPDDVAHLQVTSGTTGEPSVVVIRHRHISANVRAIARAVDVRAGDRIVSWLPLYHDMGLICLSCALHWQCPLVLTDTPNFVRHPINSWLRLIGEFRGTLSPAPASAYQVCARLGRQRAFDGLDLSSWRVGFCGAEPVALGTVTAFREVFGPYGLRPDVVRPVYGLAEATLAMTIPPASPVPDFEQVDADALEAEGRAVVRVDGGGRTQSLVCVGPAIDGHRVRVVDREGRPVEDRRVGEVEVAGPSVIDSFWSDGPAVRPDGLAAPAGFLRTGDLGYLAGGRLFITGRVKEVIIANGRNLAPAHLEAVVSDVLDGENHRGVAAVGTWNDVTGTEDVHILIECRTGPAAGRAAAEERVRSALAEAFGVGGARVHWVEKGSLPRTSSGKVRRFRCRQLIGR